MSRAIRLATMLGMLFFCTLSSAEGDKQVNALLVLPEAKTAFDRKFQDYLDANGVKLLHSYPPSVYVGYIPQTFDAELGDKYGALVYRERVEDWSSFARYGESAVYAVNAWNKRFLEDPPEAPLVVSSKVQQSGRRGDGLNLSWNEVMKAATYRLQISSDAAFTSISLDTVLPRNNYRIFPAFWKDGVYYWRVAGILTLNNGEIKEGAFSEAYSFAVSKPSKSAGPKIGAPALPAKSRFKGRPISWPSVLSAKYYRMQLSETMDFASPAVDVFTDTSTFKVSGFPVKRGITYYMRVMPSDGSSTGDWSGVSEVVIELPGPIANDVRRRFKK